MRRCALQPRVLRAGQPRSSRRSPALRVHALFNFLPGGSIKVVKVSPKTKQLAEELRELTEGSDIGTKLRSSDKEAVEELVCVDCTLLYPPRTHHPQIRSLEGQGIRAPAKSPLFYGVWEVCYMNNICLFILFMIYTDCYILVAYTIIQKP